VIALSIILLFQILQSIVSIEFYDNYLCLLYAVKLLALMLPMLYTTDRNLKQFNQKLFFFRLFLDIDFLLVVLFMYLFKLIHPFCFLMTCAVICIEETASVISVFVAEDFQRKSKKVKASQKSKSKAIIFMGKEEEEKEDGDFAK
jgi:hypothetical protein